MSDDTYTVYGRVKTGLSQRGEVEIKGLHLERAPSLEMANSFIEDAITRYKEPAVEAVIVQLIGGRDSYGSRRVIRRVSGGRAWFE
jgi:hypothetical protein